MTDTPSPAAHPPPTVPAGSQLDRTWRAAGAGLLVVGLALQTWLWLRAWLYFDQVLLYQLGVAWTKTHDPAPFAKAVSGAGVIPGALLQLLVGVPLDLWNDMRAPSLLLGGLQLAAAVVLWRTVAHHWGEATATLFLAVYWLGPWRLYHAGFIWEPTYLLLPAALHLWASLRQRDETHLLASATLGGVAVAAIQLHPSGAVLGLATLVLWATGRQRLHLVGAALGAALAASTLIPTALALARGQLPGVLPQGSISDLGLLRVHPLLKDLGYWLRLGSLDVGRRLRQVEAADLSFWAQLLGVLCAASVLVAVVAHVAYVGRGRDRSQPPDPAASYALAVLGAHLVFVGLSSVTPQGWHLLVILHAAALPVAVYLRSQLGVASRLWRVALWSFLVLRLPVVVLLGLGHPMYVIPLDDPNLDAVRSHELDRLELTPIPFGSGASVRGPVPWEAPAQPVEN